MEMRELSYDTYKGKEKLSSLVGEGIAFRFNHWLYEKDIIDETVEDTYGNMSGVRDGNRIDIHDNYRIPGTTKEFSFLYSVNNTVWAAVWDTKESKYVGEVEIDAI